MAFYRKKTKKLPDKPSALIRVALKDLEAIEKMKGFEIDMSGWHYRMDGICYVCLAGAVMEKTFGVGSNPIYKPNEFEEGYKLLAIDRFRVGLVDLGFDRLGLFCLDGLRFNRKIPEYAPRSKGEAFKKAMLELADDLEKGGY